MFHDFSTGKHKSTTIVIKYVTENEKPVIRLFGKDPQTDETIMAVDKNFKPYMYILPYDMDECISDLKEMELENIEIEEKIDIGCSVEFIKLILTHPQDVPKLRDQIRNLSSVSQIREYDIPFYRRYLIDKQIKTTNTMGSEIFLREFGRIRLPKIFT